ncbi:MAG: hypothetical protein ABF290_06050 [Thiogranum sp.]
MTSFPRDRNGNPTLESWDLFVVRHQKPSNLVGHFVSLLLFYGSPLLALLTSQPIWLVGFFSSGAVGALSHHLTGDGKINLKEATSSPRVVFYVTVLFVKLALGTYQNDIDRANARYQELLRLTRN